LREVEVSSLRVGIEAIKVEMQECSKRMARTSRQDVEQIVGELTASREVEISALHASVEALKAEMQESSTHMARTARHDMEKLVRDSTMERHPAFSRSLKVWLISSRTSQRKSASSETWKYLCQRFLANA